MHRVRYSKIWCMTDEEFNEVVSKSTSIRAVQRLLGYKGTSGSIDALIKNRIEELGVSVAHFSCGHSSGNRCKPLDDLLTKESSYSRYHLKKRLLSEKRLKNKCAACGQKPVWKGLPLVLQLDHINGNPRDNRIENLRMLCPNCHSQTGTFAGKSCTPDKDPKMFPVLLADRTCPTCHNKFSPSKIAQIYCCPPCQASKHRKKVRGTLRIKRSKQKGVCLICGAEFNKRTSGYKYCSYKCADIGRRRAERPDAATLRKLVWSTPVDVLAKQFGVSGVAIKKWCRAAGIETPGRGYWAQVQAGKIKPKIVK